MLPACLARHANPRPKSTLATRRCNREARQEAKNTNEKIGPEKVRRHRACVIYAQSIAAYHAGFQGRPHRPFRPCRFSEPCRGHSGVGTRTTQSPARKVIPDGAFGWVDATFAGKRPEWKVSRGL